MKILVIEDEPDLMKNIVFSLEKENYLVEQASSYKLASDKVHEFDYSCILLDISLPDGSGIDILKRLRDLGKQDSVIVISARNSLDDKILGLELGADDYLTKPFHLAELNARVKAVMRRKTFAGQKLVGLGNLLVDLDKHLVSVNEVPLPLNRKEYDILTFFLSNKNRLLSKGSIAAHVWGDHSDEADNFDFIYSQIKNLRKKLNEYGAGIEIHAIYGIGYKLRVTDENETS